MDDSRRKYGAMAFLPLVVFLVIYVGCGITFTLMGAESPFGMFPRHVAILVGIGVILLLVAMLVSLVSWLRSDILHSALLLQSGLQ